MHKMRRARGTEQPPFRAQVAFKRATIGAMAVGALAVGATAIGALAISPIAYFVFGRKRTFLEGARVRLRR
jgi:hypothetical protein